MLNEPRKRLAVLISGRGSNMEAILDATRQENYPAEVVLVISDNPEAKGLETAAEANIDAFAFARSDYSSKSHHEAAISETIDAYDIHLICLAGYMRILSADFTHRYENRIINIHPSLLPKFKGLDTHARAIQAGETEHGCTIHHVNAEMDGGEIIAQTTAPVLPDDTPDTLAARVLVEEHRLYPDTIRQLCASTAD
ncbi:MAG: phosphoribosylglycinamide formyltransferase [Pseudomonadota bacterium]